MSGEDNCKAQLQDTALRNAIAEGEFVVSSSVRTRLKLSAGEKCLYFHSLQIVNSDTYWLDIHVGNATKKLF